MNDRIRVRNVYPFAEGDRAMLAAVDPRLEFIHEGEDTPEWSAALVDPEVQVLSGSCPPPTREHTPRLRWLATSGAGIDSIIGLDPWRDGIQVTNGSGLHAVHMAEYILGAAMLASERLEARLANRTARRWDDVRHDLAGRRLRGRTAAIIGYGSVGREAARLLRACGMRILALKADPSRTIDEGWREPGTGDPDGSIPEHIVGRDGLVDIVSQADLVALTLPGSVHTKGIIDATALAAMKPEAWLVNVGRGVLIDEDALLDALRGGRIGGAVLDVTIQEPLPEDHPLWAVPNCLVTPHVSGTGDLTTLWHSTAVLLAEQLRRDLAGEPLLNVTSGAAGY